MGLYVVLGVPVALSSFTREIEDAPEPDQVLHSEPAVNRGPRTEERKHGNSLVLPHRYDDHRVCVAGWASILGPARFT